jgi:PAS domain S-box-containing protein
MGDNTWSQQIDAMRRRVATLYRSASAAPTPHELLPVAFEELQTALEELQVMYDELCQQHDQMLATREQVDAQFQAYQALFVYAPVAYLVTSLNGTIRRANLAAAALFCSAERFMIGRSLALFVPEGARRAFRERLAGLRGQSERPQTWVMRLQPWRGSGFQAMLTLEFEHSPLGRPAAIRWIVQDMATIQRAMDQVAPLHADVEERALMVGGGLE